MNADSEKSTDAIVGLFKDSVDDEIVIAGMSVDTFCYSHPHIHTHTYTYTHTHTHIDLRGGQRANDAARHALHTHTQTYTHRIHT